MSCVMLQVVHVQKRPLFCMTSLPLLLWVRKVVHFNSPIPHFHKNLQALLCLLDQNLPVYISFLISVHD